jgi:hypothetical protein
MVIVSIYWKMDEYCPAIYPCDAHAAWQLWYTLKDNPTVARIVCRDFSGFVLHPEKSFLEFHNTRCPEYKIT